MSQPTGSLTNSTLSGHRHGLELQRTGASFNAPFLYAAVCRQDLLMEIEACAALPV